MNREHGRTEVSGGLEPGQPGGPCVVLFDGVCNLCNGVVRWIFARDPEGIFRFAPLQGDFARQQLEAIGSRPSLDSIVLIVDGKAFVCSDAVLGIASRLRPPWRWMATLGRVPRPLRDFVYRCVARSRYRLWGKREACTMPPPGLRERFIDFG